MTSYQWHEVPSRIVDEPNGFMTCSYPGCGFEYIHLQHVIVQSRLREGSPDNLTAVTVSGMPREPEAYPFETSLWRDVVVLMGSCENGHEFSVSFVQHEGHTNLTVYARQRPDVQG